MKKILLLFLPLVLVGCTIGGLTTNNTEQTNSELRFADSDNAKKCVANDGEWKLLSDGCGDQCVKKFCIALVSEGCDCGPEKCWNGEICRDNPIGDELGFCVLKDYVNSIDKNNPSEIKVSLGDRGCTNKTTTDCRSFCTNNQSCEDYRGQSSSNLGDGICECSCMWGEF